MTKERMIELIEIEHECMRRGAHSECDRDCANCELVQDDQELDEMYTVVITLLKEQEAVKQKTGYWIYKKYDDMFMCSSCEKNSIRNDYPYCHWCGAKMKQEGR